MSVPTYAELRRAVHDAATYLNHPTKPDVVDRAGNTRPHDYGSVIYFDGGHVGALIDGVYLVSKGGDHEDSVFALAYHLRLSPIELDVSVVEVSANEFWLRCVGFSDGQARSWNVVAK